MEPEKKEVFSHIQKDMGKLKDLQPHTHPFWTTEQQTLNFLLNSEGKALITSLFLLGTRGPLPDLLSHLTLYSTFPNPIGFRERESPLYTHLSDP